MKDLKQKFTKIVHDILDGTIDEEGQAETKLLRLFKAQEKKVRLDLVKKVEDWWFDDNQPEWDEFIKILNK